jgi:hypothetical protein
LRRVFFEYEIEKSFTGKRLFFRGGAARSPTRIAAVVNGKADPAFMFAGLFRPYILISRAYLQGLRTAPFLPRCAAFLRDDETALQGPSKTPSLSLKNE